MKDLAVYEHIPTKRLYRVGKEVLEEVREYPHIIDRKEAEENEKDYKLMFEIYKEQ